MHITPSEAYAPIDIASLCLWKRAQSGDNQDRIRRLLCNLPLAVQQELTPRQREILRMRFTGGMSVTAIARELGVPVKFAGVGEGIDDLKPFDARSYVEAII